MICEKTCARANNWCNFLCRQMSDSNVCGEACQACECQCDKIIKIGTCGICNGNCCVSDKVHLKKKPMARKHNLGWRGYCQDFENCWGNLFDLRNRISFTYCFYLSFLALELFIYEFVCIFLIIDRHTNVLAIPYDVFKNGEFTVYVVVLMVMQFFVTVYSVTSVMTENYTMFWFAIFAQIFTGIRGGLLFLNFLESVYFIPLTLSIISVIPHICCGFCAGRKYGFKKFNKVSKSEDRREYIYWEIIGSTLYFDMLTLFCCIFLGLFLLEFTVMFYVFGVLYMVVSLILIIVYINCCYKEQWKLMTLGYISIQFYLLLYVVYKFIMVGSGYQVHELTPVWDDNEYWHLTWVLINLGASAVAAVGVRVTSFLLIFVAICCCWTDRLTFALANRKPWWAPHWWCIFLCMKTGSHVGKFCECGWCVDCGNQSGQAGRIFRAVYSRWDACCDKTGVLRGCFGLNKYRKKDFVRFINDLRQDMTVEQEIEKVGDGEEFGKKGYESYHRKANRVSGFLCDKACPCCRDGQDEEDEMEMELMDEYDYDEEEEESETESSEIWDSEEEEGEGEREREVIYHERKMEFKLLVDFVTGKGKGKTQDGEEDGEEDEGGKKKKKKKKKKRRRRGEELPPIEIWETPFHALRRLLLFYLCWVPSYIPFVKNLGCVVKNSGGKADSQGEDGQDKKKKKKKKKDGEEDGESEGEGEEEEGEGENEEVEKEKSGDGKIVGFLKSRVCCCFFKKGKSEEEEEEGEGEGGEGEGEGTEEKKKGIVGKLKGCLCCFCNLCKKKKKDEETVLSKDGEEEEIEMDDQSDVQVVEAKDEKNEENEQEEEEEEEQIVDS